MEFLQDYDATQITKTETNYAVILKNVPLNFPDENLVSAKSGSSLSLASVATTEADSVNSGGAGSQR